jgi:hypothetical protein
MKEKMKNENLVVHISKEDYENLIELLEIANEFFKKEGETLLIIECQDMIEKLKNIMGGLNGR